MQYITIEAEIANGRIVPTDNCRLPEKGRVLVTLLPDETRQPDWQAIESALGALHRPELDSGTWQRQVRDEWKERH